MNYGWIYCIFESRGYSQQSRRLFFPKWKQQWSREWSSKNRFFLLISLILFIENARRVNIYPRYEKEEGGRGKKGSSFSELAPTNSLLISAILSIHSFERNFLPGRCTDFPLFSREREPGLRIEHRVPRNAYIVDNYRNHRQVDGIATRKENASAEKRVASISVDGFVLSTCLVSILQLEIILLQRWSLLSSLIEIIISSFRISVPLSISHSSWKENEFYGFVCRSRSIFF